MYLLSIWIRDLVKPKRVCQTLLGNGVEYSGVVRKWDSFDHRKYGVFGQNAHGEIIEMLSGEQYCDTSQKQERA